MRTVFVILHYQAYDDTVSCIRSIQKLNDEAKIVLIDNASPNGSGKKLAEEYSDNENVHIILNDSNVGFSKANNQGCLYAKEKWDPDIYIVANNDITFPDRDMIKKIEDIHQRTGFDILGPDILNSRTNVHQSPARKSEPTLERARRTVVLNKIIYGLFFITYPFMRRYFHNMKENAKSVEDWDKEQENALISGSCVIFGKTYMTEREKPFDPETYFFCEEAIFTAWCKRNGKKIVYTPEIQVLHNDSASTYLEGDSKKRIRFQMRNIIDSTKIYIKELKKYR
ncbi:MAG: glycosyltransferase [Lachnospiraceae bacterium]|nr:glycosyltransferase [Lachnospiraceae bacterium]